MRLHLTVAYRAGAPPWSTDGDTGGVHEVEVQAPEGCTTRELVRALAAGRRRRASPRPADQSA